MTTAGAKLKSWAGAVKRDGIAVYLAARDPRVPWLVKGFAVLVAAYVLSPIDLIPDFIPVLGYVDDLILLPVAIAVIVRCIDPEIMAELRETAAGLAERPASRLGAGLVIGAWLAAAALLMWIFWPRAAA